MNPQEQMAALLEYRTLNEKLQMVATGFVLRTLETGWIYANRAVQEFERTAEYQGFVQPESDEMLGGTL